MSLFDNNEDEDYDFSISTSSNLSSLFGSFMHSEDSSNSLKYQAPKQPMSKPRDGSDSVDSSKEKNIGRPAQSSVILAKIVTLWKIDNNKQSTNIGKHIIAVIGSANQNLFEAIIYKDKNNILIRKTLNESSCFYQYENNFVSFYDNQNQFWSISFENDKDINTVLEEIVKNKGKLLDKRSKTTPAQEETKIIENITETTLQNDLDNGDSNTSLTKTKADILSRITKMGQQILPENPKLQVNTSTDLSDSELEENKLKRPVTTPRKLKKNFQKHEQSNPVQNRPENVTPPQVYANNNMTPNNNNQMVLNTQNLASYPQNIVYSQPFPDYSHTNFLLAQNLELKASLNEINSKLSNVLNGNTIPQNSEENKTLKSKIKILNLKIENLMSDLKNSDANYDQLKKKFDEKVKQLRQQEVRFLNEQENKSQIEEYSAKVKDLEQQLTDVQVKIYQKDEIIREQTNKIKGLEEINAENKNIEKQLLDEKESLNRKVNKLQSDLEELKIDITPSNEPELDFRELEETVRKNMSETFLQIMENFDQHSEYSFKEIQNIISKNLKKVSYSMLADLKNCNVIQK